MTESALAGPLFGPYQHDPVAWAARQIAEHRVAVAEDERKREREDEGRESRTKDPHLLTLQGLDEDLEAHVRGALSPEQNAELQEVSDTWDRIIAMLPQRRQREVPTFLTWIAEWKRLESVGQKPLTLVEFLRAEEARLSQPARAAHLLLLARQGRNSKPKLRGEGVLTTEPSRAKSKGGKMCGRGLHAMRGKNVRVRKDGKRECVACAAVTRNARRAKRDAGADDKGGTRCPNCGKARDKQFGWGWKWKKRTTDPTMWWICSRFGGCGHKWQFTDAEALAFWLKGRGPYFDYQKAAARKVGWTPELQARQYEEAGE